MNHFFTNTTKSVSLKYNILLKNPTA